jgi:hypothetical protein
MVQGPECPVAEGLERAQAELGHQAVERGRGTGFGDRAELAHLLPEIRERGVVLRWNGTAWKAVPDSPHAAVKDRKQRKRSVPLS